MKYKENKEDFQGIGGTRASGRCQALEKPLGTNAKSSCINNPSIPKNSGLGSNCLGTVYEHLDTDTGELIPFKKNAFGDLAQNLSYDNLLTERYMLQACAKYLMPFSRVSNCNRLSCGSDIGVLKSHEHKNTSFSGLQTCGSPWNCTVCSAKISERRKNEVVDALEQHIANGGITYFVTFTFRHGRKQSLVELKEKQREAFKYLRKSRGYEKYKKLVGYSGMIRALEVTWGQANGWHPHTHEIIFGDVKTSFQSIKRLLFPEWLKACEKAGLPAPSFRNGIDVRGGEKAGDYVNKYGKELTKGHMKKASGDRFSPFDLLRSYFYDQNELHGVKFVEFSDAMQGARQLYWTNGLKAKFKINDKSDDALASEAQEYSYLMGNIPLEHWKAVVNYKARSSVLIIARENEFENVLAFVSNLYDKYCASGARQKELDRVAKNRERFSKVSNTNKKRLFDGDDRDYFVKLNEMLDRAKICDYSPFDKNSEKVSDLTDKIFEKSDKRYKQYLFQKDYKAKKSEIGLIKSQISVLKSEIADMKKVL
jgi:hypothetical protein